MNSLLQTTTFFLNPSSLDQYGLFSGFSTPKSGKPYPRSGGILVWYIAALLPFWIGAGFSGFSLAWTCGVSLLLLSVGLLLGIVHLSFGVSTILAGGLVSLINVNLGTMMPFTSDDVGWLVLLALIMLIFLSAEGMVHGKSWRSQLLIFALMGVAGLGLVYYRNQKIPIGYIWSTLTMGSVSFTLAITKVTGKKLLSDGNQLSEGLGIILAMCFSLGMGWQLYPFIFTPNESAWLTIILRVFFAFGVFFTFCVTMLIISLMIGIEVSDDEKKENGSRAQQEILTPTQSKVGLAATPKKKSTRIASKSDLAKFIDWVRPLSERQDPAIESLGKAFAERVTWTHRATGTADSMQLLSFSVINGLYGSFLVFAAFFSIPQALLMSAIAAGCYGLAGITLLVPSKDDKFGWLDVAVVVVSGMACAFLAVKFVQERTLLIALFTPESEITYWTMAVGLFIGAAVFFTLSGFHWSSRITGLVTCLGLLYFNDLVQGSIFNFIFLLGIVIAGAFVGAKHTLLFPFATWIMHRQRKYIQTNGELSQSSYAALAALIELPLWPIPPIRHSLLEVLAQQGLPESVFVTERVQEEYKDAQARICEQAIRNAQSFAEILVIDQQRLTPALKSTIQEFVKLQPISSNNIEKVRAYASTLHGLPEPPTPIEAQALTHLIKLVYQDIRPLVADYWSVYAAFPTVLSSDKSSLISAPPTDGHLEREQITDYVRKIIASIEAFATAMKQMETHLALLPENEREYYTIITQIADSTKTFMRTVDYAERTRIIQTDISRLVQTRASMEAAWWTINSADDQVIEQSNPWIKCLIALEHLLGTLAQWNGRYYDWALGQVIEALSTFQSVDNFPKLTKRIEDISAFGESYGSVIDTTIQKLKEIGIDGDKAFAFPKGYSQRMGLQDTLDKVRELQNNLDNDRETQTLQEPLKTIFRTLNDYLFAPSDMQENEFRNPYQAGNPIQLKRAALFKGRLNLAESIVTMLRSRSKPTLILYGARRMGKTSFLLQLPRLLPSSYMPVFLDMQGSGAQQDDASFMYAIASAIYRQMRSEYKLQKPDLNEYKANPYTTLPDWLNDIQPLLGAKILFLTIDEFEATGSAIKEGRLTTQVLEQLRHLMQHFENMVLMFAGVHTIDALGPNAASYFVSAYPIEIGYLHEKDAEELVRNPDPEAGSMPAYEDDVVQDIIRLTHCQPYLIQAICSEIIGIANSKSIKAIDKNVLNQAVIQTLNTSLYFQNIWADTSKEGRIILKKLVEGPLSLAVEKVDDQVLTDLVSRRVICKLADGMYEIEIPLVRTWIEHC